MTKKQMRQRIRSLQIERAEKITSLATDSNGECLKQTHTHIIHLNRRYNSKIKTLFYCLECDCQETIERLLRLEGLQPKGE